MSDEQVVLKENWRDLVVEAIAEFPSDLRQLVGYGTESATTVVIKVAVNGAIGEEVECEIETIKVTWWDSERELLRSHELPQGHLAGERDGATVLR